MKLRPTIAVAIHDGFYGCGTGAGYANYGLLETLVSLLPDDVRLVILPLLLKPGSPEHHPAWHRRSRALLHRAEILPVDNGTGGHDRWGSLEHFGSLVSSTAKRLNDVRRSSDPLLVLAFDAPFLGLGSVLQPDALERLVLVPRSSALIHAPHDQDRIDWEREGLRAGASGGARIATISRFMADHLHEDYGVPRAAMLPLRDGLTPADWARFDTTVFSSAEAEFVFAMGRAEPYKGFDDLLDAWQILGASGRALPHLVLAATSESPTPTPYQQRLLRKVHRLGPGVHLRTRFTPAVADLLRQPGLVATVVPSHAEPFGRIPMEAFAAGAGPVITTTSQGLRGQVADGRTGFLSCAGSPESLADALRRALDLTPDQRFTMRHRARQTALRDYDHVAAVHTFLACAAPWLRLPAPDDRLRWLSAATPATSQGSPVSTVPPVKVPIGLQAPHWTTIHPERRVLVVAHHVTSLLRLLDVLPAFDSDTRIQLVFTWNGSDPFSHGLHQYLDHLGVIVIPWSQAIDTEFDLAIAANHGGLTEINAPVVILPHGAGYTKNSPGNRKPETGNRKPETGNRKPVRLRLVAGMAAVRRPADRRVAGPGTRRGIRAADGAYPGRGGERSGRRRSGLRPDGPQQASARPVSRSARCRPAPEAGDDLQHLVATLPAGQLALTVPCNHREPRP
jgi:glycosyltransferase involved in cell wall biosynthesis